MENIEDKKINNGIKEIKNIKMTSVEKNHIFQNILSQNTPNPQPIRSPWSAFFFTINYSPYFKFMVFIFIILAGGGIIISTNNNKNIAISPSPNYYQEMGLTGNNSYKIPNNNISTIENNKISVNIEKKTNEDSQINQTRLNTFSNSMAAALGPNVIYKTKKDYSNNISICYENGEITCFPGPTDVLYQRPTKLADGYFLKKMSGNVFLNTTIDEFIKYEGDWASFIKIENIIDYSPFTEIYNCPPGISEDEINEIILSNNLQNSCVDILDQN